MPRGAWEVPTLLLLAAAGAGCGGVADAGPGAVPADSGPGAPREAPPPPRCPTDEFLYVRWTLDGRPGEVCSSDELATCDLHDSHPSWSELFPDSLCSFGGNPQCFYPPRFRGIRLMLLNVALLSGATGALATSEGRRDRRFPVEIGDDGRTPFGELELALNRPGHACDFGPDANDRVYATGGRWRVVAGGDFCHPITRLDCDIVEVQAWDVRFDPIDGSHDFRLEHVFWRGRVGVQYDRPRAPGDAGPS